MVWKANSYYWHRSVFYYTLFYLIIFYYTLFYPIVFYYILFYPIVLYYALFYSIVVNYTLFYPIVFYYTLFHTIFFYCTLFYGPVPRKHVQTPSSPLRSGHIYMRDAHSAESNEKSCFRFFIFWVMADCIYNLPKIYRPKENVVQK